MKNQKSKKITNDKKELSSIIETIIDTKEKYNYSLKELMLVEAIKKIPNSFMNLTVQDVAKDLKIGENSANQVFKRDDFPSVNLGKPKTVTLLAYLIWKMDRKV